MCVNTYLNSNYFLVRITECPCENFQKTGVGEERSANIGLSRRIRMYPETVELKEIVMRRCKNEKLKAKKSFTVDRVKTEEDDVFDWDFTAVLDNDVIAILSAKNGGICDWVLTDVDSRGCGLATTLMEYCFTDDNVGGIDVQKRNDFQKEYLKNWRNMAIEYCEHIVFLKCLADPVLDACSGYMTAAINTGHTLLFSIKKIPQQGRPVYFHMSLFNVAETQPEFKKDAQSWIATNGEIWYFCKCKTKMCTIL